MTRTASYEVRRVVSIMCVLDSAAPDLSLSPRSFASSVWSPRQSESDGRCYRHNATIVGLHQLPVALVDLPVMPCAEQDLVLKLRSAAMDPVQNVVSVAPRRGPLASRPPAVPVARIERTPRGSRDNPLGPPDVDHHGFLHQDPSDAAVAGPALHRLR